jgi:DnaK suppressor protein
MASKLRPKKSTVRHSQGQKKEIKHAKAQAKGIKHTKKVQRSDMKHTKVQGKALKDTKAQAKALKDTKAQAKPLKDAKTPGSELKEGLGSFKKDLLMLREELLKGIGENLKTARSAPEREVGDFYDDVDLEKDKQMSHMMGERERAKLNDIDDAIEKIQDGSYGTCEECGEEINKKRLKIIPFARYCVRCQADVERRIAFMPESTEEQLIYKDISMNDMEGGEE